MKKIFVIILFLFTVVNVCAAPFQFLPQTITQPNGKIINCYASGDEFNNWLHCENGYTIIQDENTGFFTYANEVDEKLVATKFIVGKDEIPNTIPKWLIPKKSIENIYSKKNNENIFTTNDANRNKGNFYNLVIFIKFAGDDDFQLPASHYDSLFNAKNSPSLKDYYSEVSYNQIEIKSHILATNNGKVLTYSDTLKRGFYQKYSPTNTIGFSTDAEEKSRRNNLLWNASKFYSTYLPKNTELDGNNDGSIDNVTFIFKGASDTWGSMFWSQATVAGFSFKFNDKSVGKCVFLPENQIILGVIAHEIFHILGAPDLYRYDNSPTVKNVKPVDRWDIMEFANIIPQSMCAYMKFKYGNWIAKIDTILSPGKYKLNPLTKSTNNAFIVRTKNPLQSQEYFVLEYRKPIGFYEGSLEKYFNPNDSNFRFHGGLLAYRINKTSEGRGNALANPGTPDEVYFYRPNGTKTENGEPWNAAFNSKFLRPTFNHKTNPAPLLFDETDGELSISDIYEQDTVLYFTVHFRDRTFIKEPNDGDFGVRLMPVIRWDLLRDPYLYRVELSPESNFPPENEWTIQENISNDSIFYVRENLKPDTYYYLRVGILRANNTIFWSKTVIFKTAKVVAFSQNFTELCAGKTYDFEFEIYENISENTEFQLILSDKNGSFSNSNNNKILGSIKTNKSNFLTVQIPENLVSGYHYSIKLVSVSNPNFETVMTNVRILNTPQVEFLFLDSVVCLSDSFEISFEPNFETAVDCFYKFEWRVENCHLIGTSEGNNSAEILFNRIGLAEIKIIATNILGCQTTFTKQITVHQKPKIDFSGRRNVCPNEKVRYFFPENRNALIQETVEVLNGNFTRINRDSIEIIWGNFSTGTVNIKRTVGGSCSEYFSFTVDIDSIPDFEILGKTNFCEGDTVRFLSSETDTVNYNFLWEVENGGKIIGENNSVECLVAADFTEEAEFEINLFLTVSTKNQRCSTTVNKNILIFQLPEKPIIFELDSFLICSFENENFDFEILEYRWFLDGVEIENSNENKIIPPVSGLYSVEIFDRNGCFSVSEKYYFDKVSVSEKYGFDFEILMSENHIFIYLGEEVERVDFEIFDILGRTIYRGNSEGKKIIEIEKTQFPKGFYYIKFSQFSGTFFYKMLQF